MGLGLLHGYGRKRLFFFLLCVFPAEARRLVSLRGGLHSWLLRGCSGESKVARHVTLNSIPEDEEVDKDHDVVATGDGRKLHIMEESQLDDESEMKVGQSYYYYPEGMYVDEDGQLSWFNAGVRVGLGMCLGVGIGVGLLMRSYQATTSNLRWRFL
ncbi:hypothetical protein DY000_02058399 [Brassica cretica]|uniref:Uncharacterized protein n=1 Tax=Brassica cretica TaxID=69181 RepID=A0ABQ7A7Y9_BRACR|nr:hypothetical protein DY000_02058399 [Brassica cretica]